MKETVTNRHSSADRAEREGFWDELIDEIDAAAFLAVSQRHMQGLRYKGGGPEFVRLSRRCIRYRRGDLKDWAEAHIRTSTSSSGEIQDV